MVIIFRSAVSVERHIAALAGLLAKGELAFKAWHLRGRTARSNPRCVSALTLYRLMMMYRLRAELCEVSDRLETLQQPQKPCNKFWQGLGSRDGKQPLSLEREGLVSLGCCARLFPWRPAIILDE